MNVASFALKFMVQFYDDQIEDDEDDRDNDDDDGGGVEFVSKTENSRK